ncbi:hypothetical protein [Cognatilysobacter segetis]|uniref:hypothetical protein n=1 Tax=Cognatilysobacter segetis TaxID=2492394 RepID=UPI00105C3DCC|nr:hypothetical protein [Lysobacter segetis]
MFPCSSPTDDGHDDDVAGRWQRHAGAALRHVDRVIGAARQRIDQAPGTRESRLHARDRLGELIRRQEHLADLHRQIEQARGADLEYLWQRFFLQYDDFIQALSDTHVDLRHAHRTSRVQAPHGPSMR